MSSSSDRDDNWGQVSKPAATATAGAGTKPSGATAEAQLAGLLQRIADQISEADRRQSNALADMRSRLSIMTERTLPVSEMPPETPADAAVEKPAEVPALVSTTPSRTPVPLGVVAARQPDPVPSEPAHEESKGEAEAAPRPQAPPVDARLAAESAREESMRRVHAAVAQSYREQAEAKPKPPRTSLRRKPIEMPAAASGLALAPTDLALEQSIPAISKATRPVQSAPAAGEVEAVIDEVAALSDLANLTPYDAWETEAHVMRPAAPVTTPVATPRATPVQEPPVMRLSNPAGSSPGSFEQALGYLEKRIASTEHLIETLLERSHDTAAMDAVSKEIKTLSSELEHLTQRHEQIAGEIGQMASGVSQLMASAGLIGSMGRQIEQLSGALESTRSDLPRIVEQANGHLAEQVGDRLARAGEGAETGEKLAIIQNLLLTYARERQESDGRAQGGIDAIRASVDKLHARIDALEQEVGADDDILSAPQPAPAPPAMPMMSEQPRSAAPGFVPQTVRPEVAPVASAVAAMAPERADKSPALKAAAVANEPPAEVAATSEIRLTDSEGEPIAMSRDELIASARRAATAASLHTSPGGSAVRRLRSGEAPSIAGMGSTAAVGAELLRSRSFLIVAVIALFSIGGGLIYSKLTRKHTPTITIEQIAPDAPAAAAPEAIGQGAAAPKQSSLDDTIDQGPVMGQGEDMDGAASAGPVAAPADQAAPATGQAAPAAVPAAPAAKIPKVKSDKSSQLEPWLGGDADTGSEADGVPSLTAGVSLNDADEASTLLASASSDDALARLPPAAIAPLSMRQAAAAGDPGAAYEIGRRFYAGNGVPHDSAQAAVWFARAAKAGHEQAQYRLGALYERGDGVQKDLTKARAWYGRAAAGGNIKAMHNLAVLSTGQSGERPDYPTAAQWFAQAAEYGLADSQFNLAILMQNGLGLARNPAGAYKWFGIAASHGDAEAAKRRDGLRSQLKPSEVAALDRQIKSWHAKVPDRSRPAGTGTGVPSAAEPVPVPASGAPGQSASGVDILNVQKMLAGLGYDPGPLDGNLSASTSLAIKSFQERSGMPVTGAVTPELMSKLESLSG